MKQGMFDSNFTNIQTTNVKVLLSRLKFLVGVAVGRNNMQSVKNINF